MHVYIYRLYFASALSRPLTLHRPMLGPQEPGGCRRGRIRLDMSPVFVIFQRPIKFLWASLGSLRGSREVFGDPLGVTLGSLGSLGCLRTAPGRIQEAPKTQKVLSERLGGSWGAIGVILDVSGGPWFRPEGAHSLNTFLAYTFVCEAMLWLFSYVCC